MKVAIVSKNNSKTSLQSLLKNAGFKIVTKNPDVVVSHGGDGTFLVAEQLYPGVPKAAIKFGKSRTCFICSFISPEDVVRTLRKKKYRIRHLKKLETSFRGRKLRAINDIVVRNKLQTEAIRFSVYVNNKEIYKELIGDGIIAATPIGSTSYFYSAARKSFSRGIGIAFNNVYGKSVGPLFLRDRDVVKFKLLVGEAYVSADNSKHLITLKKGGSVNIKVSKETALIVK